MKDVIRYLRITPIYFSSYKYLPYSFSIAGNVSISDFALIHPKQPSTLSTPVDLSSFTIDNLSLAGSQLFIMHGKPSEAAIY